jgi:hypothetical protein
MKKGTYGFDYFLGEYVFAHEVVNLIGRFFGGCRVCDKVPVDTDFGFHNCFDCRTNSAEVGDRILFGG